MLAPLVLTVVLAAEAPALGAPSPAPVPAPAADQLPPGIAAPTALYESDVPPATAYDRFQDTGNLAPESQGLVTQLGRTVLALFLVVALIYLTMKLLLPRFIKKFPQRAGGAHLKMVERLQLDATHQVYLVDVTNGPRVLLGTSENGVHMLNAWRGGADEAFGQRMMETPNPLPSKEEADAPN